MRSRVDLSTGTFVKIAKKAERFVKETAIVGRFTTRVGGGETVDVERVECDSYKPSLESDHGKAI